MKYMSLENLLLKAAYGEDFEEELNEVMDFYKDDFNRDLLKLHLNILSSECEKLETKSLTSIVELLKNIPSSTKDLISEVFVLVNLILVMPATNSTSERSFSKLKLIKTYLRSTMGQSRLNHLVILSIYKEKLDELDLDIPIMEFIKKNESRCSIFGSI